MKFPLFSIDRFVLLFHPLVHLLLLEFYDLPIYHTMVCEVYFSTISIGKKDIRLPRERGRRIFHPPKSVFSRTFSIYSVFWCSILLSFLEKKRICPHEVREMKKVEFYCRLYSKRYSINIWRVQQHRLSSANPFLVVLKYSSSFSCPRNIFKCLSLPFRVCLLNGSKRILCRQNRER